MAAVVPEETLPKPDVVEEKEAPTEAPEEAVEKQVDGAGKDSVGDNSDSAKPGSGTVTKRRRANRRLSFADEEGGNIEEVTYHDNLHYSPIKSTALGKGGGGSSCCVIS
jgi:hypothetical protein